MNTKLIVLGPNYNGKIILKNNYRGIDRINLPTSIKDGSKRNLIDIAFRKYLSSCDYTKEDGEYLSNYELAQEIAISYTDNNENGDHYEVIEIIYEGEKPNYNFCFLGYDLVMTNIGNSSAIVNFFNDSVKTYLTGLNIESIYFFKKLLNEYFLFPEESIVKQFKAQCQNFFDEEIELKIVGIYGDKKNYTECF